MKTETEELRAAVLDVFGTEAKVDSWFTAPNEALGGKAPVEVLQLPHGVEEVKRALVSIAFGGAA